MFDEMADGVFRRQYEFLRLNIGVVIGEDGVLVIDSRESTVAATELAADIRTLTSLPVRWVVNTHWHWDHTFGNSVFADATFYGHHLCRKRLIEESDLAREDAHGWMPEDRHHEIEQVVVVPPSNTFEAMASIDIGTHVVRLGHHGRGHTNNDIVAHVSDVTFMGDLVEEGSPPNMADGYVLDWPATLKAVEPTVGAHLVPGHGNPGDHDWIHEQRASMAEVAARLLEVRHDGRAIEEAARAGPFDEAAMRTALDRGMALAKGG